MKILNFGLPRTRSSYLVDVLAKAYNLENLFEPYHNPIIDDILSKKLSGDEAWKHHLQSTMSLTSDLNNKDNFIVKLFSDALFNFHKKVYAGQNEFVFESNDCIDLYKYYNLSAYDKIYISYRKNYADLICSFLLARKRNTFLYTETNQLSLKFNKPKNTFLNYDKMEMTRLALSFYFYEHYATQLKKLPNVIFLEYDDIPVYLNSNFANVTSIYVDSCFDYKNKIKNYDEIDKDYNDIRDRLKVTLLSQ